MKRSRTLLAAAIFVLGFQQSVLASYCADHPNAKFVDLVLQGPDDTCSLFAANLAELLARKGWTLRAQRGGNFSGLPPLSPDSLLAGVVTFDAFGAHLEAQSATRVNATITRNLPTQTASLLSEEASLVVYDWAQSLCAEPFEGVSASASNLPSANTASSASALGSATTSPSATPSASVAKLANSTPIGIAFRTEGLVQRVSDSGDAGFGISLGVAVRGNTGVRPSAELRGSYFFPVNASDPNAVSLQLNRFGLRGLLGIDIFTRAFFAASLGVSAGLESVSAVPQSLTPSLQTVSTGTTLTAIFSAFAETRIRLSDNATAVADLSVDYDPAARRYLIPSNFGGQTTVLALSEFRPTLSIGFLFDVYGSGGK